MGFLAPTGIFGNPPTGVLVSPPPPPVNNLLGGGIAPASSPFSLMTQPAAPYRWFYVRQRFTRFLQNLNITAAQAKHGETSHKRVVALLNQAYWGYRHETANRILIGSWGKSTQVRPPRDVDILFILPVELYWQLEKRAGNHQSQLLQHMRSVLLTSYRATEIHSDRQVVVVPFDTYGIEIAPAFPRRDGGYLTCDTQGGGSYKYVDPLSEIADLDAADKQFKGNVRKLTRILKQWQYYCDVAIKPFHLEAVVKDILAQRSYSVSDEY